MNNINLISYSFIIALVIVALLMITKKLFKLNKKIESFKDIDNVDSKNILDSFISNSGSYPVKIINPGENEDYENQQEKINIEPQFLDDRNKIIDAAYDVLPPDDKKGNPFKKIISLIHDEPEDEKMNPKKNNYIYDLGDINGSLRNIDTNYVCGKQQWPVGFDINVKDEIKDNLKKYSRKSPYTSGLVARGYGKEGLKDYGFVCMDNNVNKWFYCRGGNACDYKKLIKED